MTYQELRDILNTLSEEQLAQDVAIYSIADDEYYQKDVEVVYTTDAQDVLDENHPVIRF